MGFYFILLRGERQRCETLGCKVRERAFFTVSTTVSVTKLIRICVLLDKSFEEFLLFAVMGTRTLFFASSGMKMVTGC